MKAVRNTGLYRNNFDYAPRATLAPDVDPRLRIALDCGFY